MALDFIDELYEDSIVILGLKKIMKYSHCQQYGLLNNVWEEQIDKMVAFCKKTALWNDALGTKIWESLSLLRTYISNLDSIKVADTIERILPDLYEAMSLRGAIDVEEGGYRFFSSKSGFLSMENTRQGLLLSSTVDPAFEAFEKATTMCTPGKRTFCSLGCELGYLAWQIFEVSDHSADVFIYEDDQAKIEYAKSFGVLGMIDDDKLHTITKADANALFGNMLDNHLTPEKETQTIFYIQSDHLEHLSAENRNMAVEILQNLGSELNFMPMIERNFYMNYSSGIKCIDKVDRSEIHDEWIVVGGGPSVDYNIDFLKDRIGKCTIIAATTIIKRLLKDEVKPDFIIAIDMQRRTYGHLEKIEDDSIPLIMYDFANWKFGEKYGGDKYLVPSSGYFFSKEIFKAAGIVPWNAHGTVTAAAIDVAIQFGAKAISLVGLDLAYPEKFSHAKETMDYAAVDKGGCIQVPAVNGGMVDTDLEMKSYIREIEEIITHNKNVIFYNMSRNGALIRGCNWKASNE